MRSLPTLLSSNLKIGWSIQVVTQGFSFFSKRFTRRGSVDRESDYVWLSGTEG